MAHKPVTPSITIVLQSRCAGRTDREEGHLSHWKGIMGKGFSPQACATSAARRKFAAWRPQFVVRHNTPNPWFVPALILVAAVLGGCNMITLPFWDMDPDHVVVDKLGDAACTLAITLAKDHVLQDGAAREHVVRVANSMIEVAKRSSPYGDTAKTFNWKVSVVADDSKENAYACPGGKIVVYTGIFRRAKDEDGLAAVLGHEMTHALARHTSPPISMANIADALEIAKSIMATNDVKHLNPEAKGVVAAFGLGSLVGVSQAFSREQELTADREGVMLMAQAGHDPQEYIGYLSRLMNPSCAGRNRVPEFLSSHPAPEKRIKAIKAVMGKGRELYKKAEKPSNGAALPGKHC